MVDQKEVAPVELATPLQRRHLKVTMAALDLQVPVLMVAVAAAVRDRRAKMDLALKVAMAATVCLPLLLARPFSMPAVAVVVGTT